MYKGIAVQTMKDTAIHPISRIDINAEKVTEKMRNDS